ncbi:MAG: 4-(cytidine 5'-diphospho)-2-C-methyl-D-erythritol kinase [Planctomycetota bacterium]|nr:4-(cytidine 5'-diphospho)-2-C-methyl-D-erythritol kinase [Planctomycetota bacterium]
MSLPQTVEVSAPAKFNPLLDVLARRDDGFHEVDTTLLAVELADHLLLARAEGEAGSVRLTLAGPHATPDIPTDERNLVVRALLAVLERVDDGPALHAHLTKDVPSQAGLGGGSSDAAAALIGVEALLGLELGSAQRGQLLAELGSDCAFFATTSGAARATGRGEVLEELSAPQGTEGEWWVALVTPQAVCPTGDVYAALNLAPSRASRETRTIAAFLSLRPTDARPLLRNQLEAAALAVTPELGRWREALEAAGAGHYRMSGSGSSFFGLYDTSWAATDGLQRVLAELEQRGLRWRGRWVTRTCGHGARVVATTSSKD